MSEQIQLPYEEIKEVASRSQLRESFRQGPTNLYWIPFDMIEERDANDREEYEYIEELADNIFENGIDTPPTVDVTKEGKVFIHKGHRRKRAIELLRSQGRDERFKDVLCFVNGASVTEIDRIIGTWTSNMGMALKPLEQANNVFKLKTYANKSNEEIAKMYGISRQKVDFLLILHSVPPEIKSQIKEGKMTATDAVASHRASKKAQKKADQKEIEAGQSTMYVTQPPKDILADEVKELKELENTPTPEEEENGIAPSVITVPPEREGKGKYDESREEIKYCQNIIRNADKLESIVSKLSAIPSGTKLDIENLVKWIQNDMTELREWVHKNKKQNKIR